MNKPRIQIIATGGTIAGRTIAGSAGDYASGAVGAAELLTAVPGLDDIAEISCWTVAAIGSENMTEAVWRDLLKALTDANRDEAVDGVVVLHGTDTMEETAYFIQLALQPDKPIVFTGAMRPTDGLSADGPANIAAAVRVAATAEAAGFGVLAVMADEIFAAREVTKVDMTSVTAFAAPNAGPLGRVTAEGVRWFRSGGVRPGGEFAGEFAAGFVPPLPWVEVVWGHAGMDGRLIEMLTAAGVRGLVYAGVGVGNVHDAARPALSAAMAGGVVVVRSSRVQRGIARLRAGEDGAGFVCAADLNPAKARVLLQLALTRGRGVDDVRRVFERQLA